MIKYWNYLRDIFHFLHLSLFMGYVGTSSNLDFTSATKLQFGGASRLGLGLQDKTSHKTAFHLQSLFAINSVLEPGFSMPENVHSEGKPGYID
jgi:hypothetical protein